MSTAAQLRTGDLERRLAEAQAVIDALLAGQIDAVVDSASPTPLLLAKAQEALRGSEERYRRIVETANEGICTIDPQSNFTFVNRVLADLLGYPAEAMVGVPLLQFLPPAEGAAQALSSLERSRQGSAEEKETRLLRKDGTELWVLLKTTPIRNPDGTHAATLAMVTDRTQHRQAEAALRKLQSQLMVSDRMASVGTLAAGVAHEINNPLAAVIANIDLATQQAARWAGCPPAGFADLLEVLRDASDAAGRVRGIVRDLKLFSRPPDDAKAPVDVRAVLESTLRIAWNEIRHRARLVKDYGPTPTVDANESRLGQIFLNLLVNAAQAIPEGAVETNEIRITTRISGARVEIDIRDSGPGIEPETMARIFEPFFTTKPVGVGTGLGLSICHGLVEDIGGEISVRSERGRGTQFRVSLPVGHLDKAQAVPAAAAAGGRRGRILAVDDEPLLLKVLQKSLEKFHDVTTLGDAAAALSAISSGAQFDLILCDLMMPRMTGMDLYDRLSETAPAMAARMIFLTGGAFTARARDFLEQVPNHRVEKPFDRKGLLALIGELVK